MHETSARALCTGRPRGIGWRARWEGGSGWGIHVTPWLIHVNVWQNPLQYCKVISLQLIKINEKRKKKEKMSKHFYICHAPQYQPGLQYKVHLKQVSNRSNMSSLIGASCMLMVCSWANMQQYWWWVGCIWDGWWCVKFGNQCSDLEILKVTLRHWHQNSRPGWGRWVEWVGRWNRFSSGGERTKEMDIQKKVWTMFYIYILI